MNLMLMDNCPLNFLQEVVMGQKKLFTKTEIVDIPIKTWPEFALKHIWPHAMQNEQFALYVPTGWSLAEGGRTPEKPFVWRLICTLEPDWIRENIETIRAARHKNKLDNSLKKPADIKIDPFWEQALMAFPFDPRRCLFSVANLFVSLYCFFADSVFSIASNRGNGTLMHKVKPPSKLSREKLSQRRKPPVYKLSSLSKCASDHKRILSMQERMDAHAAAVARKKADKEASDKMENLDIGQFLRQPAPAPPVLGSSPRASKKIVPLMVDKLVPQLVNPGQQQVISNLLHQTQLDNRDIEQIHAEHHPKAPMKMTQQSKLSGDEQSEPGQESDANMEVTPG